MLYILATPLGNLGDITERAKQTLSETDLIIAENPAYTKKLLDLLGLPAKKMIQFAEHNEQKMLMPLLSEIEALANQKKNAVIVSDAGTPGISDPGFKLIRECIARGVIVTPIPGPNAAITALCASGLPTDRFLFLGFVPKTEIKLINELEKAKQLETTIVFYESPHRILKTVAYISKHWPQAKLALARELTKLHEEFIRGSTEQVLKILEARPSIKGEFVVVVSFK